MTTQKWRDRNLKIPFRTGEVLFHVLGRPSLQGTIVDMARTTSTLTISLPPEMAAQLEEARKREHRTRSELIREALRRYFAEATPSQR